ncbi:hypothetical protein [Variovorax sp. PAMC 28711]|uniref:hypothetical protein n=1 Tax=Variovorax sp. PAMC 28711 TaxID=1795631 RepID=UPI00078CFED7|nr:hypothetical protein [Variovorax sp. PAMC 28711]AMM22996.1 hypothetical protein AX767_00325 [Variovorax sp. PAMC 28711]
MTDKTSDQHQSDLGLYARQALENPAVVEALARMKASCAQAIKECPIRDPEGLMLSVQAARITDSFERVLLGIFENGKAANARISIDSERKESRMSRVVRRIS